MSRADLDALLTQRTKDITPERREIVATMLGEMRRSSTRTVMFHAAIAERLGLNPSDHKCADLICNEVGPVTAGRLAELTGLSTGAITGVVDRLERAGFVQRVPDPQDRRRVVISGCAEGRAPDVRHLFIPLMTGMVAVCEDYTDEELKLIMGFMHRCGEMMDERAHALREASALGTVSQSASEPDAIPDEKPSKTRQKSAPTGASGKR